jgi:Uma2 family endonuclease
MPAVIFQPVARTEEALVIPDWVVDLDSFGRWVDSDDFPDEGRIDYLKGEVWVDMSREQVFSHTQVKTEFAIVLGGLIRTDDLGEYFTDGLRWSNIDVDLTVRPDGVFISNEALDDRVRLIPGAKDGYVEVEGAPDLVLEIISDSSVQKDTKRLPRLYWEAGVREYWLVDVRGERLAFSVFRHTTKGYVASRKKDGWVKSGLLGRSFRLTRKANKFRHERYVLDVR